MPIDNLPLQNNLMLNRIMKNLISKNIPQPRKNNIVKNLLKEIKYDYARCQNKIIFEKVTHNNRVTLP